MKLSGCRYCFSAPPPSARLRPVYAPRGCRRLPFGPFASPQPHFAVQEKTRSRALRPRQEWVEDWVRSNDTLVRGMPILVGGSSLVAVLLNRAVYGIAAVADASSSQSRADILTLALSVTDILAGLVWLSIRPKSITAVVPRGVECKRVDPGVSDSALHELLWTWGSLTTATCCKSLVAVYGGTCVLQIGVAAGSPEDESYLANLALYPGRSELPFLPANTHLYYNQLVRKELQLLVATL